MKGYWHFIALSASISALTVIYGHYWFIFGYFAWLFYLYLFRGLNWQVILYSSLTLLVFIFYIPSVDHTPSSVTTESSHSQLLMTGTIISPLKETPTYIQFSFEKDSDAQNLLVYYFKNDSDSRLLSDINAQYGQTCQISGKTDRVQHATNPGQFDFNDYLNRQGIDSQMIVESLSDINCTGKNALSFIHSLRRGVMSYAQAHLSDYSFGWVSALIFGEDSFISEDTIELFQYWGLSHLLAISGLHVGLIVSLIYFLLIKLNVLTKERTQILMLFFLPFYAMLAGGAPSVWRASLMVLFVLICHKLKIRMSMTDIFSLVFIGLVLMDPMLIYHIGFQLSFIVTFGLLLSKKWLKETTHPLFLIIKISFVSQMMIVPLQVGYFSVFQPLSIILNIVVVPYFSMFVIPYMFILLATSPLPLIGKGFDFAFEVVHKGFVQCIQFVDKIADYPFILGSFPLLFTLLYYLFFFTMMQRMELKKQLQAFFYGCLVVGVLVGISLKPHFSPEGRITMLDVGQGDSFVIELPYRKAVILYDAAATVSFTDWTPSDKVYKNVIKPYLYHRGIQKIDAIVLSHEDMDHMGSVQFLLDDFHVDRMITNRFYENTKDIQKEWDKHSIPMKTFQKGDAFTIVSQEFLVLSPGYEKNSPNENSLILYTVLGGKRWLLTGDMENQTEKDIREDFPELEVDVHQVAHHGSNTSTSEELMDWLRPEYSLISVGRNNMYGHPNAEVVELIHHFDSTLLRTDEHGAITYRFTKEGGDFFHFLPK